MFFLPAVLLYIKAFDRCIKKHLTHHTLKCKIKIAGGIYPLSMGKGGTMYRENKNRKVAAYARVSTDVLHSND